MNKLFENMDERFKNLDQEINFKYHSDLWNDVAQKLDDHALDNAFKTAAKTTGIKQNIDFNALDDAFMDDAFVEAAKHFETEYSTQFFNEFKSQEELLHIEDAFVTASALSQAVYTPEYWKDANLALKSEGLHHEYKPEYWQEVEQLLLADKRKAFFIRWSAVATILLLLSFLTYQTNPFNRKWSQNALYSKRTSHTFKSQQNVSEVKSNNIISSKIDAEKGKENQQLIQENYQNITKNSSHTNQSNDNQTNIVNQKVITDLPSKNKDVSVNSPTKSIMQNQEIDLIELHKHELKSISQHKNDKLLSFIDFTCLRPKAMHQLSVEVAKGVGNNFNSNNEMSFRNTLALNYKFTPAQHNKIALGLDLGVYHQNLNDFQYEANYSVYHLEGYVDHYWYKMTYKDLVYLNTNVNFYYRLHPKHSLKFGIGANRLFTSRISTKYQSGDAIQRDIGDEWGLNDAINTIDFSLNLGYEFMLNDAFSFTLSARHGIFDKTNNTYLNSTYVDLDKAVLLGLKYNLFTLH